MRRLAALWHRYGLTGLAMSRFDWWLLAGYVAAVAGVLVLALGLTR